MRARIFHDLKILLALGFIACAYAAVVITIIRLGGTIDPPIQASLIVAGVALVTGILSLLKDFIIDAVNAPRLNIKFLPNDLRDCHPTIFSNTSTGAELAQAYYFRIRIINDGWDTAEDVEVTLEEVKKFQDGRFETDIGYMPLRLFWSHWREKRFELTIPSGTYRYCDLGFVIDPNANVQGLLPAKENGNLLFWFDVFSRPNTGRSSLLPGSRYKISISAFGKNAKRATLAIDMEWKGVWDHTEAMISRGFVFR